jgi:hypothetical protein
MSNNSNILFVTGGEDVQKHVFKKYGYGYWSAAFDSILEKNGILDYVKASQEVLENPDYLNKFNILIISWLPDDFWRRSYLDSLQRYEGLVFIEGPFPEFLESYLGLKKVNDSTIQTGDLDIINEKAKAYIVNNFKEILGAKRVIRVSPKTVRTKPVPQLRWNPFAQETKLEPLAQMIVKSFKVIYLNRLKKGTIFPNSQQNIMMLLYLVTYLQKGGVFPKEDLARMDNLFESLASQKHSVDDSVLLLEIGQIINKKSSVEISNHDFTPAAVYGKILENTAKPSELEKLKIKETTLALLFATKIYRSTESGSVEDKCLKLINSYISTAGGELKFKSKLTLTDVFILANCASNLGLQDVSRIMLEKCIEVSLDHETGFFRNITFNKDKVSASGGFVPDPLIPLGFLEVVDKIQDNDDFLGEEFKAVYGSERIQKWGAAPYKIARYSCVEGADEAWFYLNDARYTGVRRKGKIMSFPFQLFSYITHFHTMEPLSEPFFDLITTSVMTLESFFFYLLDEQVSRYSKEYLKIGPWPWDKRYCLTIRHDVDRIPDKDTFEKLVDFESKHSLGVSWFWLYCRLHEGYIQDNLARGNEVALHALKHNDKGTELRALQETLHSRNGVYGECLHGGGGGGEYWLGYPSVRAAVDNGLQYTEGVSTIYNYPHVFPYLLEDGRITTEDIVTISHSMSVDTGVVRKGEAIRDPNRLFEFINNSFYVVLLNHPDVFYGRLETLISLLPKDGRVDWTCKQVVDWWNATHRKENLLISKIEETPLESVYTITAKNAHGLADPLEIRFPYFGRGTIAEVSSVHGEQVTEQGIWENRLTGHKYFRVRLDLKDSSPIKLVVKKRP